MRATRKSIGSGVIEMHVVVGRRATLKIRPSRNAKKTAPVMLEDEVLTWDLNTLVDSIGFGSGSSVRAVA